MLRPSADVFWIQAHKPRSCLGLGIGYVLLTHRFLHQCLSKTDRLARHQVDDEAVTKLM